MKKWKFKWNYGQVFVLAAWTFRSLLTMPAETRAEDFISVLESKPGTCIEAAEGDTFYVGMDAAYLGERISFCTDQWNAGSEPVQLMICLDRSGSMSTTDATRRAVSVAKTFVDSLQSRSPLSQVGVVLFRGKKDGEAWALAPLTLNSPANIAAIKTAIDSGGNRVGNTPYGAALDSCLKAFSRLPFSDNRAIIFLSDGAPNPISNYQTFIKAGKLDLLPPTHTVYLYKTTPEAATRDTLVHLAQATGGTFSDVSNASYLSTIFLDTLLTELTRVIDIGDFYLVNPKIEQFRPGQLVDTSTANPIVLFQPLTLLNGVNPISLLYTKVGPSGDTLRMMKQFTIIRTDSIPPSQETAALFSAIQYAKSTTEFLDGNGAVLGIKGYDTAAIEARIRINRWPALDNVIQIDSAVIYSASGDSEIVALLETGSATNIYTGKISFSTGAAYPLNGALDVAENDRVWIVYRNNSFFAGYHHLDVSTDSTVVTRSPNSYKPPLPHATFFVRPQSVTVCTTSNVSYQLQYSVPDGEKYSLTFLRIPNWLTALGNQLVGTAPKQTVNDSAVVVIASTSGADTLVLKIEVLTQISPAISMKEAPGMVPPMTVRLLPRSIRIQLASQCELSAWDPLGRLVLRAPAASGSRELMISASDQASGVYIVRVRRLNQYETVRLLLR